MVFYGNSLKEQPIEKRVALPEGVGIKGIWHGKAFDPSRCSHHRDRTDDEIFNEFKKNKPEYMSLYEYIEAYNCQCIERRKFTNLNKVTDGLVNTILERMTNTHTGTQDLIARKMAIGTNNNTPAAGNSQLVLESYRADFDDQVRVDNKAIFDLFLRRNQANVNETLVVADAGNSLTQFAVTPGQSVLFNIGDRIRVSTTSGFNFADINNIDTINDIITVSAPLELGEIPQAGDEVKQVIAEAGVFGNSNTGVSANTGTLYNRVNSLETVKTSDVIFILEAQFIITTT